MRLRASMVALAVILGLAAAPTTAQADIVLTPFAGVNFAGDTPDTPLTFGGGVTFVGRSIGLEIEASRTNDFFSDGQTDVSLVSASLVGGADLPGTGVKPYFLAGVGLMRTNTELANILEDTSYNNFAILLGGGLNAYFTDNIGLRGDIRYYRRLERQSDIGVIPIASNFDFFRATIGLNIRFF